MVNIVVFPMILLAFFLANALASSMDEDLAKGVTFFKLHQYEEGKTFFKKILGKNNHHSRSHYYLGRIYFELGEYDKSISHLTKAVRIQGDNPDYHFWLGRSYGAKASRSSVIKQLFLASKVKKAFRRTIKIDPNHINGRIGLANFYLKAPEMMGGSIDEAYKQAKVLVQLHEIKGKLLLARIYEKEGKFADAESEYRYLEQHYGNLPNYRDVYDDYGHFLLKRQRYDEAIWKFKKQVELSPGAPEAHVSLGDGYKAAGKLRQAAWAYHQALFVDPNFATAKHKLEVTRKALQNSPPPASTTHLD